MCEDAMTEFYCCQCDEPVCEDCCVECTYQNQLQDTLCVGCGDSNDIDRQEEVDKEYDLEQEKKLRRELINSKRKATYWKPENVEKRRVAKIKKNKERAERNRKMIEETFKIVGSMFR